MNPQTKFAAAMAAGFVAFILLLAIGGSLLNALQEPPSAQPTGAGTVSGNLWLERNFDMIILAVMMFAAVLGVLALVGGEFKWQ